MNFAVTGFEQPIVLLACAVIAVVEDASGRASTCSVEQSSPGTFILLCNGVESAKVGA